MVIRVMLINSAKSNNGKKNSTNIISFVSRLIQLGYRMGFPYSCKDVTVKEHVGKELYLVKCLAL